MSNEAVDLLIKEFAQIIVNDSMIMPSTHRVENILRDFLRAKARIEFRHIQASAGGVVDR